MKTKLTMILAAAGIVLAGAANAGTLENLERERAILLATLLDQAPDSTARQSTTQLSRARLIDLERMVLRDKTLAGKNTLLVRKAFDNYDLTFLVHAASEANRDLFDHWLEQIGVSTQSLMSARVGRR